MRIALTLLFAVVVACSGGCACPKGCPLTILGGTPVGYLCDNDRHIVARYYALSDDSLHFAKVALPSGREYTLPSVLSASGARYTDEVEKVWWTKGDTGFVQTRGPNGEWQKEYDNCRKE